MNSKEYEESVQTAIENNPKVAQFLCDESVRSWKLSKKLGKEYQSILSDNREVLAKIFGKPHFHRGEFYFHGWQIDFEGSSFVVVTAKEKGTCISILEPWEKVRKANPKVMINFVKDLSKKIKDNVNV